MSKQTDLHDPRHPAWQEYEAAADYLAARGLTGDIGDPLPELMTPEAVYLINYDVEAFQERVRLCAYARSMERSLEKSVRRETDMYSVLEPDLSTEMLLHKVATDVGTDEAHVAEIWTRIYPNAKATGKQS